MEDYSSVLQRKEGRTFSIKSEGDEEAKKEYDGEIDTLGTKKSEKQLLIQESAFLKPYRVEVFAAVVDLLNSMKIKWWISDGTLLGWYRNNQSMLPHDYDMDIGIIEDDIQAVWKSRAKLPKNIELKNVCLNDHGYIWVTDEYSKPYDPTILSSKKLAAYHLKLPPKPESGRTFFWLAPTDIISYHKEATRDIWHCNFDVNGMHLSYSEFPDDVLFPLVESKFEGISVYVPQKPKEYLEILYGYIGEDAVWDPATNKYKQRDNSY